MPLFQIPVVFVLKFMDLHQNHPLQFFCQGPPSLLHELWVTAAKKFKGAYGSRLASTSALPAHEKPVMDKKTICSQYIIEYSSN